MKSLKRELSYKESDEIRDYLDNYELNLQPNPWVETYNLWNGLNQFMWNYIYGTY